jgi:hypothetical protein
MPGPRAGHPRLKASKLKDVDGRDELGHDETLRLSPLRTFYFFGTAFLQ